MQEKKKSRKLRGDGLRVEVEVNDSRLEVVGDGCRVTVARNTGSILIIGDGSSIRVAKNEGDIEYRGDGGRISLGKGSKTESVNYIGDGGKITVAREANNKSRIAAELLQERSSVSDSEYELRKSRFKENIEKESKKEENEKRKKGKGRRRCENYNVVTKIISQDSTKIDTKNIIKNLFINPPSVFKSFKFYSTESL